MAAIVKLETCRDEKRMKEAAAVYENRAAARLQSIRTATRTLEAEKAFAVWEAVERALQLAEMAATALN